MNIRCVLFLLLAFGWKVDSFATGELPVSFDDGKLIYSHCDTSSKPAVVLEEMNLAPMKILYIPDTAGTPDLGRAFGRAYIELYRFAISNGAKPGRSMAFYHSHTEPFFLEIAVEVDAIPATLQGKIRSKQMNGGKAIVAHYTGPYEQLALPYTAITNWLRENRREAVGLPFEIYYNDPATTEKNKLKTDVCQLLR